MLKPKESKTKDIHLRFSEDDYKEISKLAKKHKIHRTQVCHDFVVAYLAKYKIKGRKPKK